MASYVKSYVLTNPPVVAVRFDDVDLERVEIHTSDSLVLSNDKAEAERIAAGPTNCGSGQFVLHGLWGVWGAMSFIGGNTVATVTIVGSGLRVSANDKGA